MWQSSGVRHSGNVPVRKTGSGRLKLGHCLPLFCFSDCSLFRSKPESTSWCFGARAGALEHELVLCAIMSKLKLSEKYIYNIVYDMAAQADPSKAK